MYKPDGYYLSTYIHIDPLAHLTWARVRHDQNISLWKKSGKNVQLIAYWELERITGIKKHSLSFYSVQDAESFINELLGPYKITLRDMQEIWGTPELAKLGKQIDIIHENKELTYHSLAHLFSSVLIDTNLFENNNIIGLAVDGGPDNVIDNNARNKKFYSGCVIRKGKIDAMFPVSSPALLWSYARVKYNMEQGTLMALAEATKSKYYGKFAHIKTIDDKTTSAEAYKWFEKVHKEIFDLKQSDSDCLFSGFDERFSETLNKISMVIKIIQMESQYIMYNSIKDIINNYNINTQETYLSISGGYGLNCVSNSALMKSFNFKGFIAPPCISDTGQSLGIALYSFYKNINSFNFSLKHPYYGDDDSLNAILNDAEWSKYIKSVSKMEANTFVEDIENGPIIWFNGRSEIGPRALGNRSILADPRNENSKNVLNKIKEREWWRPVAPIIIESHLDNWFEDAYLSPFMLNTFKIKKDKLTQVPAISHMDTSSRIQTLNKQTNPLLFDAIYAFFNKTGVPILCNTSLNDKGEPIVNKISEAFNFALRKHIKCLYINGYRVILDLCIPYYATKPLSRNSAAVNKFTVDEKKCELKKLNPYNLSRTFIEFYYLYPSLKNNYNITDKQDIDKLKKVIDRLMPSDLIND